MSAWRAEPRGRPAAAGRRVTTASRMSATLRPVFADTADRVVGREPYRLLDHLLGAGDVGAREVDLVDHRDNLEPVRDRQIRVRKCLRFHPLRGVNHQESALAAGEGARDFVRKVDVAGGVNEVELVKLWPS